MNDTTDAVVPVLYGHTKVLQSLAVGFRRSMKYLPKGVPNYCNLWQVHREKSDKLTKSTF